MRIFAGLLWLCSFGLIAQQGQVSVETYGKLPEKSLMSISPSANRMAYRDTKDGRDLVVVIDLIQKKVISVADATEVNPTDIYFIDDDRVILLAVENNRIWGYRGTHDISSAYVYNVLSNTIHPLLTPGYGIHVGQTNVGNIIGISADRKYAFMPAWKDRGEFSLFKVNLEEKRKPQVVQKGTSDSIGFFLNQNNEVIARERYNNKKNLHRVEARIAGKWLEIFKEKTDYRTKGFRGVTPDGKYLVMRSHHPKTKRWAFYTLSLTDGTISAPLFNHEDKDVESMLTGLDQVVHGVKYSGFKSSYEFFDNKLNRLMQGIGSALSDASINIRDHTPDFKQILFYVDGNQNSGDYFMYNKGNLAFVSASRPDIPPEAINPTTIKQFNARDGLSIPTLLTLPKEVNPKSLPAILLPHGGPESYDQFGFDYLVQYFASQGYAVIQPQFRGSKGFGYRHLILGRGEWGRKMQDDLTDAVNHFAELGTINKDKVCIVGASYGGYAALAGATFTPDLYQCVISINGVANVDRMLKSERRQYGKDHWVLSYWQDVITSGEVKEDHLKAISPLNHVSKIQAPVLLIHGEYDDVVPLRQSEDMFEKMKDAGKNVQFVELEKGNHHLSSSKNRMKAMKAIDQFVKKHI